MAICNWFWGSHGCDHDLGHDGNHMCGDADDPCSEYDGEHVRFALFCEDEHGEMAHDGWSNWSDMPYGFQMEPYRVEGD